MALMLARIASRCKTPFVFLMFIAAGNACLVQFARADWPDKPITLVVGFAAGAGTDTFARVLATKLSQQLGQRVIVENRPGANANIAAESVSRSAPDGYTLFYNTTSLPISAGLYKNLGYDPAKDLIPVARVVSFPLILVATPKFPPTTPAAFVDYLKLHPNQTNYGSGGAGNIVNLGVAMLLKEIGAESTQIAYKGISHAIVDLLSGELQFMITGLSSVAPYLESNRLRPIAALSLERLQQLPNLPTISESVLPGFEVDAWYGIMAPSRTPDSIIQKMSFAVARAMEDQELKNSLEKQGGRSIVSNSFEYKSFLQKEFSRYKKIIDDIDLKPE